MQEFEEIKYFWVKYVLFYYKYSVILESFFFFFLIIILIMVRFHTLIFATLASVYALSPEAASKLKSELATGNIIPQSNL